MTQPPAPEHSHPCRRCGAEVALGAPYCPECGLVQAGAPARGRTRERPGRSPWLIPALIAGALASLVGGALLSVAINRDDPVAEQPSASAGASASSGSSASQEPEPSASPTPSPSPTAAPIANRAVALVANTGTVLRANPSDTAAALADLAAGSRLFVIGDPEESGEQRWYRVGTFDNLGCSDACGLIGWVATPIAETAPVIEEASVSCPSSPMSAEALAAVPALDALHCYGRSEIEVTGVVDLVEGEYDGPYRYSPTWLAHPFTAAVLRGGITFHPLPDASLELPEQDDEVRVRGHFEDPGATSCRVSAAPDAGDAEVPQSSRAVLDCRATFVWTDYEVIGGG